MTLFIVVALATCRLIGIASVGADEYNAVAVAYELLTSAFVAVALRREGRAGAPAPA